MTKLFLSLFSFPLLGGASILCPLLGPDFFPPTDYTSTVLREAFDKFTATLDNLTDETTSYAVQFFTSHQEKPVYEYYYSAPNLDSSTGVSEIDGNSIFRIASISKLLTVYTLLAEIGDTYWDQPVTKFVPEVRKFIPKSKRYPIHYPQWDEITLGALAGQLSGLTRDLAALSATPITLESLSFNMSDPTVYGLPPLDPSDLPPCVLNVTDMCSRSEFFNAFKTRDAVYLPYTTPVYSNTNFQVLAYALESITGVPFSKMLERTLIKPLNLTGTSHSTPDASRGAIPIDPASSWWNFQMGEFAPFGGIYSNANDLATIGRSILSSTLLPPNTTRAWLKPVTHSASLQLSIGRPWEITRLVQPYPQNRIVDVYTKGGDLPLYHSLIGLLPDYDFGFVVMVAGSKDAMSVGGLVGEIVAPALEDAARETATVNFGGTYRASGGLNSSIVFSTQRQNPGLGVDSWISNSSNIIDGFKMILGSQSDIAIRLYPTNLEQSVRQPGRKRATGTYKIAFRSVAQTLEQVPESGSPLPCTSLFSVDAVTWGRGAFDEFIFTVDKSGKALSVEIPFLKVTLIRINES